MNPSRSVMARVALATGAAFLFPGWASQMPAGAYRLRRRRAGL